MNKKKILFIRQTFEIIKLLLQIIWILLLILHWLDF